MNLTLSLLASIFAYLVFTGQILGYRPIKI